MRLFPLLLLVSLCTIFAACDSDPMNEPPPPPPPLDGAWTGQITSQGTTFTFEMTLTDAMTIVAGTGTVRSAQDTVAYTLDGSYVHPTINLRLNFAADPPGSLNGTVSDDRRRIQGTIAGPRFGGGAIALTKQANSP